MKNAHFLMHFFGLIEEALRLGAADLRALQKGWRDGLEGVKGNSKSIFEGVKGALSILAVQRKDRAVPSGRG